MELSSTRKNKCNHFYRNDIKMKQKKLCPGQGREPDSPLRCQPTVSNKQQNCLELINLNRGKIRYKVAGNL